GGLPTISFRDITIQRDADDLVGASFGRGFYVLDDISPLRDFDTSKMGEATLFKVQTADWYIQKSSVGSQGNTEYVAKNPPYGAVFTYYLPEKLKSLKEVRKENEKDVNKQNSNINFPGWEALDKETNQEKPSIFLVVKDNDGNTINTVNGTNKKGFNRVSWNLSHANRTGVPLKKPKKGGNNFFGSPFRATPGTYTVELYQNIDGTVTQLSGGQSFEVKRLSEGALPAKPTDEIDAFRNGFQEFRQDLMATNTVLEKSLTKLEAMQRALGQAKKPTPGLNSKIHNAKTSLLQLKSVMKGSAAKNEVGERNAPSPEDGSFIGFVALGNTYGPTGNQKAAFQRANSQLQDVKKELNVFVKNTIPRLESELKAAGAPWIEGQGLIQN
ncbi:MAG: glycosyl hydrolase, partial [Bacteroidota bacterium]